MPETQANTATLRRALKIGSANGQSVEALAFATGAEPRTIRHQVDELIDAGVPVVAHPKTGYYIAATQADVDIACAFLNDRISHTLNKINGLLRAWVAWSNQTQSAQSEEETHA